MWEPGSSTYCSDQQNAATGEMCTGANRYEYSALGKSLRSCNPGTLAAGSQEVWMDLEEGWDIGRKNCCMKMIRKG